MSGWVPPYSPLIHAIDWPLVIANFSFPVEIVTAIPLDHRLPEPNMLARRFDGLDDRIFAFDATLGQWRHIPDYGTFQAMGFYWCDVTAADSGFFGRDRAVHPFLATILTAQQGEGCRRARGMSWSLAQSHGRPDDHSGAVPRLALRLECER